MKRVFKKNGLVLRLFVVQVLAGIGLLGFSSEASAAITYDIEASCSETHYNITLRPKYVEKRFGGLPVASDCLASIEANLALLQPRRLSPSFEDSSTIEVGDEPCNGFLGVSPVSFSVPLAEFMSEDETSNNNLEDLLDYIQIEIIAYRTDNSKITADNSGATGGLSTTTDESVEVIGVPINTPDIFRDTKFLARATASDANSNGLSACEFNFCDITNNECGAGGDCEYNEKCIPIGDAIGKRPGTCSKTSECNDCNSRTAGKCGGSGADASGCQAGERCVQSGTSTDPTFVCEPDPTCDSDPNQCKNLGECGEAADSCYDNEECVEDFFVPPGGTPGVYNVCKFTSGGTCDSTDSECSTASECRGNCGPNEQPLCISGKCECRTPPPASDPNLQGNNRPIGESRELGNFLSVINSMIFPAGIGLAAFFIVKSGYVLMISQGNPKEVQDAQDQLTSAILGSIFIIMSSAILRFIFTSIL